jgi:hypothetical protein
MKFTLPPQRRFVSLTYDGNRYWVAVADDGTVWARRTLVADSFTPWAELRNVQPLPVPEQEDNTDAR